MDIKMENIDAAFASKLLAQYNPINRSLRPRVVAAFAKDMKEGRWNGLNGETIKIGKDGNLKDGQHRLSAVVEADVTVPMAVAYNVPNDSQETVDTGVRRHYSDVLSMRGITDTTVVASVVRLVALYLRGVRPGSSPYITNPQLDEVMNTYPTLVEVSHEARKIASSSGKLLPASLIGLLIWQFNQLENAEEDISHFFTRLCDGQNLQEGNPIYTLRKKLTAIRDTSTHKSINTRIAGALTIKAWNAYRDGNELRVLRYTPGGANPETYPEPH